MSFQSKLGGLLFRHSSLTIGISKSPIPGMLNFTRCISSTKLFIGGNFSSLLPAKSITFKYQFTQNFIILTFCILGLSYGTDDQSLREAFNPFGNVVEGQSNMSFSLLSSKQYKVCIRKINVICSFEVFNLCPTCYSLHFKF